MYYSPVCYKIKIIKILFNLHVLGLLLAFILSQDQTLINFSFILFTICIVIYNNVWPLLIFQQSWNISKATEESYVLTNKPKNRLGKLNLNALLINSVYRPFGNEQTFGYKVTKPLVTKLPNPTSLGKGLLCYRVTLLQGYFVTKRKFFYLFYLF